MGGFITILYLMYPNESLVRSMYAFRWPELWCIIRMNKRSSYCSSLLLVNSLQLHFYIKQLNNTKLKLKILKMNIILEQEMIRIIYYGIFINNQHFPPIFFTRQSCKLLYDSNVQHKKDNSNFFVRTTSA